MFHLVPEIEVRFVMEPYDMDRASNKQAVLGLIRRRVEGCCHPEHGVIIQVSRRATGDENIVVKRCAVRSDGIHVTALLGCIVFNGTPPPIQSKRTTSCC